MDKLFQQLPKGIGYELTGLSYQEAAVRRPGAALYALSILVIYLCLAALYESWAIPLSVMLVIPLGVIGALRRPRCADCSTTSISRSACSPPSACRPRTPS